MALTIKLNDPDTIAILQHYSLFISLHDGVDGTLEQAAEGLILGCLDEHTRFVKWKQGLDAEPARNVIPFRQPEAAEEPRQNHVARGG